jgi:hypothetical protein
MPKFFFHLIGDLTAHDLLGHECATMEEARDRGNLLAHRIGTDKPGLIRDGNYIAVADHGGNELFQIPLASTTV